MATTTAALVTTARNQRGIEPAGERRPDPAAGQAGRGHDRHRQPLHGSEGDEDQQGDRVDHEHERAPLSALTRLSRSDRNRPSTPRSSTLTPAPK